MSNAADWRTAVADDDAVPQEAEPRRSGSAGSVSTRSRLKLNDSAASSLISPRRIIWPILLSLIVLGVIGAFTFQPGEFQTIISELNPWMLGLALLTVVFRVYLGGWRLDYISKGKLGKAGGVRAQLAWDFFSNVTPSAIGGAPFAAVYIARDKRMNLGSATGLMLFTMLLDQLWFALTIPVVLVAALAVEVIPSSLGTVGAAGFTLYFVGMLAWVVLFGYATMFRPDLLQRLTRLVLSIKWLRRYKDRVDREMIQLQERARMLRTQRAGFYINGMLLTIGTWAARYLLLLFIVWSFLPDFDKILLLLRTAAMTLGSLVMPTPGGAGGIEGLYALFVGPLLPAALLMPTLLIWRFLGYYLFVGLGIFLSTHHVQKTIRRNRQDARDLQTRNESTRAEHPANLPEEVPEEVAESR